jgi:hypothetical protein
MMKLQDVILKAMAAERALALCQEKYGDWNVRHFHEKLREEGRPSGGACAKIWR